MGETELDKQLEAIVDQLAERFNLAISLAVDEEKTFDQGEQVFQEALAVLEYYNCNNLVADQLINFSKVAFFRKKYDRALYYAAIATEKANVQDKIEMAHQNLHGMAFKILDLLLMHEDDAISVIDYEDLQEFLIPEDYCHALRNVYHSFQCVKSQEEKDFLSEVIKKLSLEVMKQGIRQEKKNHTDAALLLFKTALPFLNPKRAEIIKNEINKIEESHHE